MSVVEQPSQLNPVEVFFTPESFDVAQASGATALHCTVNGLDRVNHFMREQIGRDMRIPPADLTIVLYRLVAFGEGPADKHFFELPDDAPLVPASQLTTYRGEAHTVVPKQEVVLRRRRVLEVQSREFIGSLTHRLVWNALNPPPDDARLAPSPRRFVPAWAEAVKLALAGPSVGEMQRVADEAKQHFPHALYIAGR